MIIQGSNEPIVLEFDRDMSEVQKFSAVLFKQAKALSTNSIDSELKKWSREDAFIEDGKVILGLKEEETMKFPVGVATLEVKWLDNADVMFADEVQIDVVKWFDKTRLTDD